MHAKDDDNVTWEYYMKTETAEIASGAVGWYADLAGWHYFPTNSEGYGEFRLKPNNKISSGTVQIAGQYKHALYGTLGLSVKGVGISVSGSNDDLATSQTISLAPRTGG